jgi:hypothetical protein
LEAARALGEIAEEADMMRLNFIHILEPSHGQIGKTSSARNNRKMQADTETALFDRSSMSIA